MGLDSFIVARRKDNPEIEIELYYERNFLNWIIFFAEEQKFQMKSMNTL